MSEENALESLRLEFIKDIARLEATVAILLEQVREDRADRRKAQEDRDNMQAQIRGLGERMVDLINEMKQTRETLSVIKPAVRGLEDDRLMVTAAGNLAKIMTRGLWLIGGMIITAIGAIATWFGLIKPPHP